MKIINSFMTESPYYKRARKMTIKGIVLHSFGCQSSDPTGTIKRWNSASFTRASIHYMIASKDGSIYHTQPDDYSVPHCGGAYNSDHIGVEMLESNYIKYTKGDRFDVIDHEKAEKDVSTAYNAAVELLAYLCDKYKLNPSTDIVSHHEAHLLGKASGHSDPEHLWEQLKLPYTMDGFRKDVAAKMGNAVVIQTIQPSSEFKVKCLDNLNVRKSPNMGDNIVTPDGCKQGGVYTIVETNGNWGLLKSFSAKKDGWICISSKYVKRV